MGKKKKFQGSMLPDSPGFMFTTSGSAPGKEKSLIRANSTKETEASAAAVEE